MLLDFPEAEMLNEEDQDALGEVVSINNFFLLINFHNIRNNPNDSRVYEITILPDLRGEEKIQINTGDA